MLTALEVTTIRDSIKTNYPNIIPLATDAVIDNNILILEPFLNKRCKRKDEILQLDVVHKIISDNENSQALALGNNVPVQEIDSLSISDDIKINFKAESHETLDDPNSNQSIYGIRSAILKKNCAKSMVGVIR